MGESDYDTVLGEIVKFFGNTPTFPPIFTNVPQIPMIKSIFEQLCSEKADLDNFKIYPLFQLLFMLKREAASYGIDENQGFASIHIAQSMIDRDQYDYQREIACNVSS